MNKSMTLMLLAACVSHGAAQAAEGASPDAAQSAPPSSPSADKFEGAVGLLLAYKPAYSGASDFKLKPEVAGFLRYGRFTVTGAGGFTTRRQDDVERGLDAELVRRDDLRMSLSLRIDPGRQEADSPALSGMGDIRLTVRARLGVRWNVGKQWQLSLGSSVDALNRVGGYLVEAGVSHTIPIDAQQRLILSAGVSGAGDRHMQAWYGVTAAQSAASGYPVYTPREGLKDAGIGITWRTELGPQWAAFAGASASRLLGGAADSPLTRKAEGWSMQAALVRRF
ncbi:MAG TPA: MipA/OmpV family protein [Burkholderiaceae bacterium]|nr:MipA/OmpV family protein [Burkholderiaceae bacterium]